VKRPITFSLLLDYLLYLLVRLLEQVIICIPERTAVAAGAFLGRIVYVLLPDRRNAAIENLSTAFGGEKSPQWIVKTARKSFEHIGIVAVEFFRIRRWSQEDMAERIVVQGRMPINLAMMPGNNGILLLNSHFGCFEVSAALVKSLGWKLNLLATGLKNPFLTRYFLSRGGKDSGVTTYPHKGVVKEMIRLMLSGEMVAVLGDQRGDVERGIFVDYFGTKAPANEVFARLAIDGNAYVMPLCTYRRDDGRYQSILGEEIRIELTGDRKTDLTRVSQQFHSVFEEWLRIKPEQGFWLQRKWKRKPSRRRSRKKGGRSIPALGSLSEGKGVDRSGGTGGSK